MRFIHIADVHLGAQPEAGTAYSAKRPRELWDTFARIIDLCEVQHVDVLLIAGDLFHRQPLLRELKEVNYLFSKLTHTRVVFIAGNHDYVRKDSYYCTFKWNENVYPLLGAKMGCVEIPEFELAVYGFSYHSRQITEECCNVKAPGKYRYEIMLAHGGDEKHIPLRKEALETSGFDYIALGHIHKPAILLENHAAYAGALEPVDISDTGRHGYISGEISPAGTYAEFVPFASREYIHLAFRVQESMSSGGVGDSVRDAVEKQGIHNIYKLVLRGLRDQEIVFDTDNMDIYGNILEIADETQPAYNYQKLYVENKENIIGKYIERFWACEDGSIERQALQEGVQALLENHL